VGRPRKFDPDEVLEQAMCEFWESGFHALSTRALEESTGVLKGSLYAAYGDKRALFLTALERYAAAGQAEVEAMLAAAPTPRAGLETYLRARASQCTGPRRTRGCLLANAAVELAPHDEEVSAVLGRAYTRLTATLEQAVRAAQERGELPQNRDPRATASFLVLLVQGMSVVGKVARGAPMVRSALEMALGLLDSAERPDDEGGA
jgi:TetR/AcrR family transcriptional repressor of nem operon